MRRPDDPILGYCTRLLRGGEGDPSIMPAALAATVQAHGIAGLLPGHRPDVEARACAAARGADGPGQAGRRARHGGPLEVRRVLALLAEAGIVSLVLKGSALALWLYREPWHRSRGDFDLLVPDKAAAKRVVDLLLAQGYGLLAGVAPDEADGYEVALQRGDGIVIDLHWRLLNTTVRARALSWHELEADRGRSVSRQAQQQGRAQATAAQPAMQMESGRLVEVIS